MGVSICRLGQSMNELISLYRAPFKWDGIAYIFDADHNMVADFWNPITAWGNDGTFRVRGWGRFGQMEDGERLYDAMEKLLLDLTKDHPADPTKCVQALNDFWAKEAP